MKTAIKVVLDTAICLGFLALLEPKLGPLSIHEWGGLAICVLFLVHKLLNWSWIKSVPTKFFSRTLPAWVRLNYVLDLLLFLGFSTIALSGMAIAKTIDFSWLFPSGAGFIWRVLHGFASFLILAATGLHIGLHWNWIAARFARSAAHAKRALDAE